LDVTRTSVGAVPLIGHLHPLRAGWLALIGLWMVGCGGVPSVPPPEALSSAVAPIAPAATQTAAAPTSTTPTLRPPPQATPALPAVFAATGLRPGIEPHTYLSDACQAMRQRWDPAGSAPGTVVLPIMYHSIRDPSRMLADSVTVSTDYFYATIDLARSLGFETITAAELAAFLSGNARIPARSMLLIVDDRRPGVVADYLLPVAEAYDWTVALGWIIGDTRPSLWATMEVWPRAADSMSSHTASITATSSKGSPKTRCVTRSAARFRSWRTISAIGRRRSSGRAVISLDEASRSPARRAIAWGSRRSRAAPCSSTGFPWAKRRRRSATR
jgi:hypothetical protein